jgi:chemotaxis protein methyltransferase CheR
MKNPTPDSENKPRTLSAALEKKLLIFKEIDFKDLKEKVQKVLGVKLDGYREEYILRRISYHFNKSHTSSLEEYLSNLAKDKKNVIDLLDCLTVNLSYFFRDKQSFEFLHKEVLPELLRKNGIIKISSMGCSIGAEIYSIAILLHSMRALNRAELIAVDNDPGVLTRAISGKFYSNELRAIPESYKKYFTELENEQKSKTQKTFILSSMFRNSVSFHQHDLTSGMPLKNKNKNKKFHLITCRNVMIYFSQETKEQLYLQFYDWLEPGGILFIGANELLVGPARKQFQMIHSQFYRKPIM